MLCDCPGLVFPQFATTKADLVCDGVLPIDQMREYTAPVELLVRRIATPLLEAKYGLTISRKLADEGGDGNIHATDLLKAYASEYTELNSRFSHSCRRFPCASCSAARGFTRAGQGNPDEARAARYILKDYVDGKLLFCHPPSGTSGEEFNKAQQALLLEALQRVGKKKAPTTRVTKDAVTYTGPSGASAGSALGQSARSRKLDDDFFADGTGLSDKPFTKNVRGGDQAFVRVMSYPHQKVVGNDGRPIEGGVQIPIPVGKNHYKGKREKHRSGKGYD